MKYYIKIKFSLINDTLNIHIGYSANAEVLLHKKRFYNGCKREVPSVLK